jgi:hypothetical protein
MLIRRVTLTLATTAALAAAAAACGTTAADPVAAPAGRQTLSPVPGLVSTTAPGATTAPASTGALPTDGPIGGRVSGNGVILIGDSVLAGTSSRYGGEMCAALVPLDWRVELDAETGRFIEWGNEVLDARLSAGWDAALIFLGNNFLGDKEQYKFQLERMVNRLAPAPVVLVKVSRYRKDRDLVNEAIDELAAAYADRIEVIDWGALTKADEDLTGRDKLHLSDAGRARLAAEVAAVLGQAPVAPGDCLSSKFTDDSRGAVTGGGGGGGGGVTTTSTGGTSPGSTDPTTTSEATTTSETTTTVGP